MSMKKRIWLFYGILVFCALAVTGGTFLKKDFQAEETAVVSFQEDIAETRQVSQTYSLSRGVYRVTIDYKAGTTNNYVYAASDQEPEKTGCDKLLLERSKEQESFLVWIRGRVEDFCVIGEYTGNGSFSISRVHIQETKLGKIHDLFYAACLCAFLFLIFKSGMKQGFFQKQLPAAAILLLITALASIPLFTKGTYIGHDSGFHFNRLEGVWQGLASGQFPVRIQPSWLHGYGYAVSICYGDILLYIPGFLRMIGFSVQEAYEWFVFLINGATAVTAYYCCKKISGSEKAALAGSFLYTLSVYRIVNVYIRAAVGEYCAMIFLPVVFYGFWCILEEREGKKNWIPLMLGLSGLIQTHILSCEIVGIFGIILGAVYIKRILQRENLLAFAKAFAGTILLNAWFLVPFLHYMLREHLNINAKGFIEISIQNTGASLKQLFGIFMYGLGSGGANGTLPKGIGLGLWLAVFFCSAVWLKYRRKEHKADVIGLQLLLGGIALICATKYFPWDFMIQSGAGFFASLQFPWRFLGIAVTFLCGAVCCCIHVLERSCKIRLINHCLFIIIGAAVLSSGYTMLTFMRDGDLQECYEQRDAPYYVSGGEYLPSDIKFSENAFHSLAPLAANVEITAYEKKYNRIVVDCENLMEEENILQVPILLYRGYYAGDADTKEEFSLIRTENGMTGIGLPGGYKGKVCMEFREPFLWRISEMISIITILLLCIYRASGAGCMRNAVYRLRERGDRKL